MKIKNLLSVELLRLGNLILLLGVSIAFLGGLWPAGQKTSAQTNASPTATPIPLGFSGNPVTSNAQWEPVIQTITGVEMVLVPTGCFMMGSDSLAAYADERPVHEQCFESPFWIDRYEVTQAQFKQFGGQKANDNYFAGADHPLEQITWFEARDYCAKRGARLPTEREWEYAARGPDHWPHPWGEDWNEEYAVWDGTAEGKTAPVGSRSPAGDSWVGAADMSGNVWEWLSTLYQPYPYVGDDGREDQEDSSGLRVLRGGSWRGPNALFLSVSLRIDFEPDGQSLDLGLRCASDY